jgi:hypothetical protein
MTENKSLLQFLPHPYAEPDMKIFITRETILEIFEPEDLESLTLPMPLIGESQSEEVPDISGPPTIGLSPAIPETGTVEGPPKPEPSVVWNVVSYMVSISHLPGMQLLAWLLQSMLSLS